ncbi:MAG: alanine dehydrogenase [Saprospiraceae bacterium]|nr:alanine dehydrogenase [Saprospiraceae bacterium]
MKLGIICEGKVPPDIRVPLNPAQCANLMERFPIEIIVEPSALRCFRDEEYEAAGVPLSTYMSDCDVLLGVKEVPVDRLIPGKTYSFFSHTIKKQPYNRKLLQAILAKDIRLIDYEVMTDEKGQRVVAFGYFAGMVGAYNGIMTYGMRTGAFHLKRLHECHDYSEAEAQYAGIQFPPMRIVLSGTGRVSSGAAQVLTDMGIRQVSPGEYLTHTYSEPVFTQISCLDYAARKDMHGFSRADYYTHPEEFVSAFAPYARVSDIFINGIFWEKRAPAFFTKEDMRRADFNIRVIADITCDIAPNSSIPSTLFATSIANPIFGYDPFLEHEASPHQSHVIDMMTIDNLPSELPRDASTAFGEMLIKHLIPELLAKDSPMVERATIADGGGLKPRFSYLQDYVEENTRVG